MAQNQEKLDATVETRKKVPSEVVVEGRTLKVKRTGAALKKIIEMTPEPDADGVVPDTDPADSVDQLYQSLASLLIDPDTNESVDWEWLSQELDFEVANEWMEKLVPAGNSARAPLPPVASTSEPVPSTATSTPEPEQPATEESDQPISTDSTGTKEAISQTA